MHKTQVMHQTLSFKTIIICQDFCLTWVTYLKLSSYTLSYLLALITKFLSLSFVISHLLLHLMLQPKIRVHICHQLQKARRRYGQLSHLETFLSSCLPHAASAAPYFPFSDLLLQWLSFLFLSYWLQQQPYFQGQGETFHQHNSNCPDRPSENWFYFVVIINR